MTAPVAIFGVGNRSRGDDALGPQLLDRLAGWIGARGLGDRFDLLEAYQLQVENALDLEGRSLALFIDAWRGAPADAVLSRIGPAVTTMSCDSHRLEPAAVLDVHRRVTGREPPPAFALGVRAERFELGEGLSEASHRALEEAWPLLQSLAVDPRLASWEARASILAHTGGDHHGDTQDTGRGQGGEREARRRTETGREAHHEEAG